MEAVWKIRQIQFMGSPFLHVASTRETSWNNLLLHLVFLPQGMGFFLSPLFSTRGTGMPFSLLRCKESLCWANQFCFPIPLHSPADPSQTCSWTPLVLLGKESSITAHSDSCTAPASSPGTQQPKFHFLLAKWLEEKKWACARQLELGLLDKAPPAGRKWSRVGKNRVICSRSESVLSEGKRIDKVGGWTL